MSKCPQHSYAVLKQFFYLRRICMFLLAFCLLLLPLACKKDQAPSPEPPSLFFTQWGANTEQIKTLETGEVVSDRSGFLVYKAVVADYPGYITYEFVDDQLVRLVWNINVKGDSAVKDALARAVEDLVAAHLQNPRYIRASKTLFADAQSLAETQCVKGLSGISCKTVFYDLKHASNANILKTFDKLWQEEKWEKGRMDESTAP